MISNLVVPRTTNKFPAFILKTELRERFQIYLLVNCEKFRTRNVNVCTF